MKTIKYAFLALLLAPLSVQSATAPADVWLEFQNGTSSSDPYQIGDVFTAEIHVTANEFFYSGAIDLYFDETVVNVISSTITILDGMGDPPNYSSSGMPPVGGVLSELSFITYYDVYDPYMDHKVAEIQFQAVGPGLASPLFMSVDPTSNQYWEGDYSGEFTPNFIPADVTVNPVPLPAAAWFMISGLGFLAFRRKRTA